MSEWHRRRLEAAARALSGLSAGDDDYRRAAAVVHAADAAVYGVVPREEFEQLALDYSAMKIRALQVEDLVSRALETLDEIAAGAGPHEARDVAFATATELRAVLAAHSDSDDDY
jgi:hypothetical protein